MTKDMPCQHVLYQSYLCYSSIIKIRLVFVSIYNSQYHFLSCQPSCGTFLPSVLYSHFPQGGLSCPSSFRGAFPLIFKIFLSQILFYASGSKV